ncbi:MAG TPA: type II toxin-antitoxin system RelE/ParE family toxin [Candidatus Angelobacter sp.]|nr:type II toxin-antitoxin system RelE/ParE family toxin [Candidatus Angelobacter sp.]
MYVKWLRTALRNLDEIGEYVANDNPKAADRAVTAIWDAVQLLSDFPALGRPGRVLGTRELVVSGTPYIIPYRIRGNRVEILRVFHGARKWPKRFGHK